MRSPRPGLEALAGVVATTVALVVLLVPSPVGIADNGDQVRLLCPLGLQPDVAYQGRPFFDFVNLQYVARTDSAGCPAYTSNQSLLLRAAGAGTRVLLPGPARLDLRVLAVLCALLFGGCVWLVVRALPGRLAVRAVTAALVILGLGDIAFTGYFVSALSEPASLLGLLAVAAGLLHLWRRPRASTLALLGLTLAALVLVTAKVQNAALAGPIALALVWRPWGTRPGWLASRAVPAVAALVVLLTAGAYLQHQPAALRETNKYNAVFYELLANSPDPAADLRELGLDPGLARFAGTSFFTPDNATSDPAYPQVPATVSYLDLARFYLRHPDRTAALTARGTRAVATTRPDYLGSYPQSEGNAPGAQACRLCLTSSLGAALEPAAPVLLPLLWLAALSAPLVSGRRQRASGAALTAATLALMAVVELAISLLGEGSYEIVKHLYLVAATTVLLVPLTLAAWVELGASRWARPDHQDLPEPVAAVT